MIRYWSPLRMIWQRSTGRNKPCQIDFNSLSRRQKATSKQSLDVALMRLIIPILSRILRTNQNFLVRLVRVRIFWSGQQDLNLRPHGPQPCALPSYAIPRNQQMLLYQNFSKNQHFFRKFFGLIPKYFRKAPEKCSGEE